MIFVNLFREKNGARFTADGGLKGKSLLPTFVDDGICHRCGTIDKSWILVTLHQEQVAPQERTSACQQVALIADSQGICLEIGPERIVNRLQPIPRSGSRRQRKKYRPTPLVQ
ncbi:MAG: hypothetical protein V2J11_01110 [Desulfofustis sp.]|jgi:hypothetical protein|nr:hypothetical protein [Desulfofustis sp.]